MSLPRLQQGEGRSNNVPQIHIHPEPQNVTLRGRYNLLSVLGKISPKSRTGVLIRATQGGRG